MNNRVMESKPFVFPGWDGPMVRGQNRRRSGSASQLERRIAKPLLSRGRGALASSESLTSLSSYQTARKDVDYKISEAGDSLTCVTSAEAEWTRAEVADTDMPYDVQRYALAVVKDAVRAHRMFREVAGYIKRAMDSKFGFCWQCHVGKEFGLRISYLPGSYMFLTVESQAVILYKSQAL